MTPRRMSCSRGFNRERGIFHSLSNSWVSGAYLFIFHVFAIISDVQSKGLLRVVISAQQDIC